LTGLFALVVSPNVAHAVGAGVITKALDGTQGGGFTAPNTFETGALVRYRLTASCNSNVSSCEIGTITDVLDPRLEYMGIVKPVTTVPINATSSGQTVTITLGTAASPWPDGNQLEIILVARVRNSATGTIPNQSSITTTGGPTSQSQIVNIITPDPEPQWQIDKSQASPAGSPAAGGDIRYVINFNAAAYGNVDVTGGTLVDTYPAGAVVVSADGGVVDTVNHTITWTVPPMRIPADASCGYQPAPYECRAGFYKTITLNFPSPPFLAGNTVVNTAKADLNYANGTSGTLTDSVSSTFIAPVYTNGFSKYGPATVVAGTTIKWMVDVPYNGNIAVPNFTVTDTLPTSGVSNLQLQRDYLDYNPINPRTGGPITFQYTTDGGATWIDWFVSTATDTWTTKPIPSGATGFRMIDASMSPGHRMTMYVTGTVTGAVGDVLTNCATLTGGGGLPTSGPSCPKTTVVAPFTQLQINKNHAVTDTAVDSVKPGETFWWAISVGHTDGVQPTTINVADLLPPQFDYLGTVCIIQNGNTGDPRSSVNSFLNDTCTSPYVSPSFRLPTVQPTVSTVSTPVPGTTLLQWKDYPTPASWTRGAMIHFIIRVAAKAGTAVANYTNLTQVSTNSVPYTCNASWLIKPLPDTADIDGDGNTTETICQNENAIQVREAAIADSFKWVKGNLNENVAEANGMADPNCPDWDGYTRYPCVATLTPGGSFTYRWQLQNSGNIDLTDFWVYDILPVVGDTGVTQVLQNDQRGTDWSPVMTGPITPVAGFTIPAGAGYTVEYNLTSNPCRVQMSQPVPNLTWQASCDDNWYTAAQITDWTTVKSFRIHAFGDATWLPAEQLVFEAPFRAPLSAPQSTPDDPATAANEFNLSVAWNSLGFQVARKNTVNNVVGWEELPASAPRKVGVIVPFTVPPAVSVGDYFWYDADKDGIQDADELPVKGALVRLLAADGTEIGSTTTNEFGYYSFINLVPDTDYIIEFVNPDEANYAFTTQNSGGTTDNSRTGDLTDSDVDVTTGRVAFNSGPAGDNLPGGPTQADAGTDNPGLDAGLVEVVKAVSIGDFVWWDNNRNGIQDAGEPVVADGFVVNLYAADGTTLVKSTTTVGGYYAFADLTPGATYVVEFVRNAASSTDKASFTTQNSSGDSTNSPADDVTDSDADVTTGRVTVVAPLSGSNLVDPNKADNPGIDAGLVQYNLLLEKTLSTAGPFTTGQDVTFVLTPKNEGPSTAMALWSVTDLIPTGLTITSMTGTGYDCTIDAAKTTGTCVAAGALAGGTVAAPVAGEPITVVATIGATFTGTAHNVAFVAPNADDPVAETNPLTEPERDKTLTDTTGTDNDAQADLTVPMVSIGDYVWWDNNRNGVQDAGEPVVADGFVVNLYAADGTTLLKSTTTVGGYYAFGDLTPNTTYVVEFVRNAASATDTASFTVVNSGGVTSNSATADLTDSDADPTTGRVLAVVTPATGANSVAPNSADNHGIDAGLVKYNLTLDKAITSAGPYYEGGTVTYTLTPANAGPSEALPGWTVTDLLPVGLTVDSFTATGYTCTTDAAKTTLSCTSTATTNFAVGAGPVITVVAKIGANVTGDRDCPPNGVSDLTRQRGLAGRLVTDDRDNHERELDAQGCQEETLVVDGDAVGEGGDRATGEGGAGAG